MASKENQEYLDYIKNYLFKFEHQCCWYQLDKLQEAIDDLQSLKENYIGYEDLKAEYEAKIERCHQAVDIYEKALDLACIDIQGRSNAGGVEYLRYKFVEEATRKME